MIIKFLKNILSKQIPEIPEIGSVWIIFVNPFEKYEVTILDVKQKWVQY